MLGVGDDMVGCREFFGARFSVWLGYAGHGPALAEEHHSFWFLTLRM